MRRYDVDKTTGSSLSDDHNSTLRHRNTVHDTTLESSLKRKDRRERRKRKQNQRQYPSNVVLIMITILFVLLLVRFVMKNDSHDNNNNDKRISDSVIIDKTETDRKQKENEAKEKRSNLRNKPPKWENKMEHLHNNVWAHDSLVDPQIANILESEWPHPIIHVVNTRFMQNQAQFPILARARLELFKTFCYTTMAHASANDDKGLIWIIKTDPNLPPDILQELITLLEPHDNFFLVASLENFGIGHAPGAWRGGIESEEVLSHAQDAIYTGDITKLRAARQLEKDRIVLETRLDADDGLATEYLDRVQKEALALFLTEKDKKLWSNPLLKKDLDIKSEVNDDDEVPKWFYWCVKIHGEWFADPYSTETSEEKLNTYAKGHLNAVKHDKMCVTPGLTIGFNIGTNYQDVPEFPHAVLYNRLQTSSECRNNNKKNMKCIQLLDYKDISILAIRARTPTSAGMMDIKVGEAKKTRLPPQTQKRLWLFLQSSHFMISTSKIISIQTYIRQNLVGIAKENLKGQCTQGHSCKLSSREKLQRIIDLEEQKNEKHGKSIDMVKNIKLT